MRVLELILGWQVSTASILLSAESSWFFRCFAISDYIAITAIYLNLRNYRQCVYKVIRLTFPSVSDILGEAIIDM